MLQLSRTHAESPSHVGVFEANHNPVPVASGVVATERAVVSAPVDDLEQGEVVQVSLDGEWTVNHDEYGWGNPKRWAATLRHRVILGSSPQDTTGVEIGAPLRDSVTPDQHHGVLQRTVTYSVPSDQPGRRWINVVARVEPDVGPNGNDGFMPGLAGWPVTWPFGVVEATYSTASIARWSDETDSTTGRFVGLGRSVTSLKSTLPQDGSRWAIRTAELELQPGDTVILNAESNIELPGWRYGTTQIDDEIRVERPASADGIDGPRAGSSSFDVLLPVDAKGASHQRYHGINKRVGWVVPSGYPAGTYSFHHVLRASSPSPTGAVHVGLGEMTALALRTTSVPWRARRSSAPGQAATLLDSEVIPAAQRAQLTSGYSSYVWASAANRSAAASLRIGGDTADCKQQPTNEYGPSTRIGDQRGAPRLAISSNGLTTRPLITAPSPNTFARRHVPLTASSGGAIEVRLDNPYSNPFRADGPTANLACSRGYTPAELHLYSAPIPARTRVASTALLTAATTTVREIPPDPTNGVVLHQAPVHGVKAGDRVLFMYHGIVENDNPPGTTPSLVGTSLTVTDGSDGTIQSFLRPAGENVTAGQRFLSIRRQGWWEAPSTWTTPRTATFKFLMSASSTGGAPVRIAENASGVGQSHSQGLVVRAP